MGLGIVSLQTSQKKEPAGAPFTGNSAFNGTSIDPLNGKVVLGNNVGDVPGDAALQTNREIVMNGLSIQLVDFEPGPVSRMSLFDNTLRIDDLVNGNSFKVNVNAANIQTTVQSLVNGVIWNMSSPGGSVGFVTEGPGNISLANLVESFAMILNAGSQVLNILSSGGNGLNLDAATNDVASTGTLSTANPLNGSGKWKLGTVVAGVVAPDAANYVEVDIGGAIVKLIKAV